MLAFLLFALFFSLVYYMHFHAAIHTWKKLKGKKSDEVDTGYVRLEDYFGQSFRSKLRGWLRQPQSLNTGASMRVIDKGGEKIFIANEANYPDSHGETEILVVEGDFTCGANCIFGKELFVRHDCVVGHSSELQALAVDGMARLNPGTKVRRWVDASGFLDIRGNCRILSRATSRSSIRFGPGAQAKSLFAPEVITQGRREDISAWAVNEGLVLELPALATANVIGGFDSSKMIAMGGDCYRYEGNLKLDAAVHLTKPLIVRGDFHCARESFIEADVKASGSIFIGDGSLVKSNLVAQGTLTLGRGVFFQGILRSGGVMRLRHGVRGLREGIPVAAYADGPLLVESNCVINGKLSSAQYVRAVATPMDWFETENLKLVSGS